MSSIVFHSSNNHPQVSPNLNDESSDDDIISISENEEEYQSNMVRENNKRILLEEYKEDNKKLRKENVKLKHELSIFIRRNQKLKRAMKIMLEDDDSNDNNMTHDEMKSSSSCLSSSSSHTSIKSNSVMRTAVQDARSMSDDGNNDSDDGNNDSDDDSDDDSDEDYDSITHNTRNSSKNNSNARKKSIPWSSNEDSILIREWKRCKNQGDTIAEAFKYLPGRTMKAVSNRWRRLKLLGVEIDTNNDNDEDNDNSCGSTAGDNVESNNKNITTTTLRIAKKWTRDEDSIIAREWNKSKINYADEATKYLPGRTRDAIYLRWKENLSKYFMTTPAMDAAEDSVVSGRRRNERQRERERKNSNKRLRVKNKYYFS